jgi:hypothetical protein
VDARGKGRSGVQSVSPCVAALDRCKAQARVITAGATGGAGSNQIQWARLNEAYSSPAERIMIASTTTYIPCHCSSGM